MPKQLPTSPADRPRRVVRLKPPDYQPRPAELE